MKAVLKPNYDKDRANLADVLPIPTPYTVLIEITRLCNFECYYCMHSTKHDPDGEYSNYRLSRDFMEMGLFKKLSAQISAMEPQPKRVLILGLGEPLVDRELPEMIRMLREDGFCGRVDIVTNGSLFTPELCDQLTDAGISKIIISLQGLDADAYEKNCGKRIDFDRFVKNLTYLYQHRKGAHIYIKIIDTMLEGPEGREKFFRIFGDICDTCNIEHIIVNQSQMGDHGGIVNHQVNLHGEPVLEREICPMPFYQMQIYLDGTVLMCPISGAPKELVIGNAYEETLLDMWNGKKRFDLLKRLLLEKREAYACCKNCESMQNIASDSENIDHVYKKILERMEQAYGITN